MKNINTFPLGDCFLEGSLTSVVYTVQFRRASTHLKTSKQTKKRLECAFFVYARYITSLIFVFMPQSRQGKSSLPHLLAIT